MDHRQSNLFAQPLGEQGCPVGTWRSATIHTVVVLRYSVGGPLCTPVRAWTYLKADLIVPQLLSRAGVLAQGLTGSQASHSQWYSPSMAGHSSWVVR